MFVDSDDYLPENINIERLMEYSKKYDIMQGYIQLVDTEGNHIGRLTPDHLYGYVCGKVYHHSVFENFMFPENY